MELIKLTFVDIFVHIHHSNRREVAYNFRTGSTNCVVLLVSTTKKRQKNDSLLERRKKNTTFFSLKFEIYLKIYKILCNNYRKKKKILLKNHYKRM